MDTNWRKAGSVHREIIYREGTQRTQRKKVFQWKANKSKLTCWLGELRNGPVFLCVPCTANVSILRFWRGFPPPASLEAQSHRGTEKIRNGRGIENRTRGAPRTSILDTLSSWRGRVVLSPLHLSPGYFNTQSHITQQSKSLFLTTWQANWF